MRFDCRTAGKGLNDATSRKFLSCLRLSCMLSNNLKNSLLFQMSGQTSRALSSKNVRGMCHEKQNFNRLKTPEKPNGNINKHGKAYIRITNARQNKQKSQKFEIPVQYPCVKL